MSKALEFQTQRTNINSSPTMTATITHHAIPEDPRNEHEHPIPYLNVIDVSGYRVDGGANLTVVIASPLQGDEASQIRLLDKIQGHLGHLHSEGFAADARTSPPPENTTITIAIRPESSDVIFALLARCHSWVHSNGATLVIQKLPGADECQPP